MAVQTTTWPLCNHSNRKWMINFSSSKLWSAWLKLLVSFFLTLTRKIAKLWSTWLKLLVFYRYFSAAGETDKLVLSKFLSKQAAPRSLPDITLLDKITVLYLVVQMRHVLQDKLQDCWSRLEQFHTTFSDKTTTQILVYTAIYFALWGQIQNNWMK